MANNFVDYGYGAVDRGKPGDDWTNGGQYKPYGWVGGQWKGVPTTTIDPSDPTISPQVKALLYSTNSADAQAQAYKKRTGVPQGTYAPTAYQPMSWEQPQAANINGTPTKGQGQYTLQPMLNPGGMMSQMGGGNWYQNQPGAISNPGQGGGGQLGMPQYMGQPNSYLRDVGGTMQRQVVGTPAMAQIPGQGQQSPQVNPNNVNNANPSWTNSRPNSWWGFRTDYQQPQSSNWNSGGSPDMFPRGPSGLPNGQPAGASIGGQPTGWYTSRGGITNPTQPNYGGNQAQASPAQPMNWYANRGGITNPTSRTISGYPNYLGGLMSALYGG